MFERLHSVPLGDAIEAVYEALLRMGQPARSEAIRQGSPIPLALDPLALSVLEEIQREAGKHIADLSDGEMNRYARALGALVSARVRAEIAVPPGRGEQILQELRAEYGAPFYGRRSPTLPAVDHGAGKRAARTA